jgi:hypothetical protein
MSTPGRIIVVGASLLMQMIADELAQTWPGEVIMLNPYAPQRLTRIAQLCPAVVLVEHTPGTSGALNDLVLELLYTHPGLPILSLDANQPLAYRLSSARLSACSMQELAQALAASV